MKPRGGLRSPKGGPPPYTVPRVEHGPKMFLQFSPLIDEKNSSFLTYLKSW